MTHGSPGDDRMDPILDALQERAKELSCLYHVDEILSATDRPSNEVFRDLLDAIPSGWKFPRITRARLRLGDTVHATADHVETPWTMTAPIRVDTETVGELIVSYLEKRPDATEGPFLREERRLIDAIARRVSMFVAAERRPRDVRPSANDGHTEDGDGEARPVGVIRFLRETDPRLLTRITTKMINHMCWSGIEEARELLRESSGQPSAGGDDEGDDNLPLKRRAMANLEAIADRTFEMAHRHFSEERILAQIGSWMNEERAEVLDSALERPGTTLGEIAAALRDFRRSNVDEAALPAPVRASLRTSLLRRLMTDRLDFLRRARGFVDVRDAEDLLEHMIYSPRSQGKIGGKASGLTLATQVIRKSEEYADLLRDVKVPRTWYVASDGLTEFVHYNMLDDLMNRKYQEIERIRQDYPHVVQVFKNSPFPPELVKGFSAALDDLDDTPLVVRSSSLLEDQVGAAFSGKYKSLFLANQGTKRERLAALLDAVAEIYASVFGPDPIEYRAERGLLDFQEEMGILIQEVVGRRVGRYYLPAFAGVAFSRNEFRWSPRIRREDGLIRLVPGLGTRAVDRLADDYPILIAPAQPQLQVNVTPEEVSRYSPQKIDVINLEKNRFETVRIEALLRECGDDYPMVRDVVSILDGDRIRRPSGLEPDWDKDDLVVTFEGLLARTPFVSQVRAILRLLEEKLDLPMDIEFASDGTDFYLLQCRAQSFLSQEGPAAIPRELPEEQVVFSAHRFVSNGRMPDITHVVVVDPDRYAELGSLEELRDVGRAVGRLNRLLPKRQFILMGPGRWGSRGDIKLGVSVTYSEINNTAMLIEIARQRGQYVPQLSFGTHFFQDLVEAGIRYLPLYPDEPGNVFNTLFLLRSRNLLPDLVPEFAHLTDTVRVIDVGAETGGQVLRILMNAELDEAVGVLGTAGEADEAVESAPTEVAASSPAHWRWRMRMAKRIAALADPARFDIRRMYVFGSTKNATAGPGSDLDLLVHVGDDAARREELLVWLDGWSHALAEMNYLRTGYRSDGLLDVHLVTDEDIARRSSFAVKIGAVTDAARPLPTGGGAVSSG